MRSVAALVLASMALAGATAAQPPDGTRFRVVNRTGEVAIGLYASAPGQEGQNLIAGRAMRPGQTARVTRNRPGCLVDVRLVTAGGAVFDRPSIDVCREAEVVFTNGLRMETQGPATSPEAIASVQRALATLGYDPGIPDGQIGPRTQGAIASFQRDRGMPPTGLLDGRTLAAIRASSPAGSADGKPPPLSGAPAIASGKPPPSSGPDRPEPIPGRRTAAAPRAPSRPPPAQAGGQRRASTGTGFVVGEGRLLTNQHVIANCTGISGVVQGERRVPLSLIAIDSERDLALLSGPRDLGPVLSFRDGPPRRGDEVVTYGFPLTGILGSGPTLTTGEVSALTGIRDDRNTMIISAPVQSGNSGGPLLDRSGHVLGVIVAKLNALRVAERTGGDLPQNVNIAIHGQVAQEFLRRNGVTPRTASSSTDKSVAEVGEIAHPSTVLVECMR